MKLAAIFNLWDGEEHLPKSLSYIKDYVDEIIIVWQDRSNFGIKYCPKIDIEALQQLLNCVNCLHLIKYEPIIKNTKEDGTINERNKRNIGLDKAKELNCTHFLLMDVDEYYPDFKVLKEEFINSGADGSVCGMQMYLAKETYQLQPMLDWKVPFIHKLNADTKIVNSYPYEVDQTRRTEAKNVVFLSKPMHHLSWVRNDIERKIGSSSATGRNNEAIRRDIRVLKCKGIATFKSEYFGQRYVIETDVLTR